MRDRRALICGITGQDGAYLARALLREGYRVIGTTRGKPARGSANLRGLEVEAQVELLQMDPADGERVRAVLAKLRPDDIYYLSAQSSVWRSFADPGETFRASAEGIVNLLEAARLLLPDARIFYAASGDCFGETSEEAPATEASPFRPRSPYAAAKCAGHHAVAVSRLAYGQFACSGFLFTHESPLRSEDFAIGKTAAAARRIASGSSERLILGNVEAVRDWGWAPDVVEAMRRMLQPDAPEDFVIASGTSHKVADFVARIFAAHGLDWQEHVELDARPSRPTDIQVQHADPSMVRARLGWSAGTGFDEMAKLLAR